MTIKQNPQAEKIQPGNKGESPLIPPQGESEKGSMSDSPTQEVWLRTFHLIGIGAVSAGDDVTGAHREAWEKSTKVAISNYTKEKEDKKE